MKSFVGINVVNLNHQRFIYQPIESLSSLNVVNYSIHSFVRFFFIIRSSNASKHTCWKRNYLLANKSTRSKHSTEKCGLTILKPYFIYFWRVSRFHIVRDVLLGGLRLTLFLQFPKRVTGIFAVSMGVADD